MIEINNRNNLKSDFNSNFNNLTNIVYKNKIGRIEEKFVSLKKQNKKALITFITGGYPNIVNFLDIFFILENSGVDIIEIGIPFSDPIADGPVIQYSSNTAINNGFNTKVLLNSIEKFRRKSSLPIAVMTYFNIIYNYGLKQFLHDISNAGVDGIIVPDLPLEEFLKYKSIFLSSKISKIMLVSRSTDQYRIKEISSYCSGFLYCVLIKGVTGLKSNINNDTREFLKMVKRNTHLPLAVGFGISEMTQIIKIKDFCDGIIIGSKIISLIKESENKGITKDYSKLIKFISQIKSEL